MEVIAIIVVFAVIGIVIRLVAGGMDGDRVGRYIHSQGGQLLDSQWSPFGRGWFGEKNDRIYKVRYRDRFGNIHEATAKTSMFSGVYFTEDRIIQPAAPANPHSRDLEGENARLRKRIAELERRDRT